MADTGHMEAEEKHLLKAEMGNDQEKLPWCRDVQMSLEVGLAHPCDCVQTIPDLHDSFAYSLSDHLAYVKSREKKQ